LQCRNALVTHADRPGRAGIAGYRDDFPPALCRAGILQEMMLPCASTSTARRSTEWIGSPKNWRTWSEFARETSAQSLTKIDVIRSRMRIAIVCNRALGRR